MSNSNRYKTYSIETDSLAYTFDYNRIETQRIRERLEHNDKVSVEDLRRVALWKIGRVLDIDDETLQSLRDLVADQDLQLDSPSVLETITNLLTCRGVGMPMASSFLKFLRPDIFPIMDVRAYRALTGKKLYSYQYSIELYINYSGKLHDIAKELDMKLSDVDEQLYLFDKEFNGKI